MGKTLGIINLKPDIWEQTTPVDTVTIPHTRKKLCPRVVVLDNDGNEIDVVVDYLNDSQLQISFGIPITFTAYID